MLTMDDVLAVVKRIESAQWEYSTIERPSKFALEEKGEALALLNQMGADRWQLCAVTDAAYYFKRQKVYKPSPVKAGAII